MRECFPRGSSVVKLNETIDVDLKEGIYLALWCQAERRMNVSSLPLFDESRHVQLSWATRALPWGVGGVCDATSRNVQEEKVVNIFASFVWRAAVEEWMSSPLNAWLAVVFVWRCPGTSADNHPYQGAPSLGNSALLLSPTMVSFFLSFLLLFRVSFQHLRFSL